MSAYDRKRRKMTLEQLEAERRAERERQHTAEQARLDEPITRRELLEALALAERHVLTPALELFLANFIKYLQ